MRQRPVRLLLGTALGAALLSAPVPVAGATVPDLAPSPSRAVVRDPVRDIISSQTGNLTNKLKPTINFTRLAVTYGPMALRIRGFFVDLKPRRTQETPGVPGYRVRYDIGTPNNPINGEWFVVTTGPDAVFVGFNFPGCFFARARWAYRRDFVNVRVPWRCLTGLPSPRRIVVQGTSGFDLETYDDEVPGRFFTDLATPPIFRPAA
jgi:hypothetical protein